jgi:hypothetical protein
MSAARPNAGPGAGARIEGEGDEEMKLPLV